MRIKGVFPLSRTQLKRFEDYLFFHNFEAYNIDGRKILILSWTVTWSLTYYFISEIKYDYCLD